MTIEEKKEYLKSYRKIGRELRSLSEEINQLRLSQIMPGIVSDGLPKSSGGSDLSGYAARLGFSSPPRGFFFSITLQVH